MIVLLAVLAASALAAAALGAVWTQIHPVAAITAAALLVTALTRRVRQLTAAKAPSTGSAKRKHDQFVAAWHAAGHQVKADGPAAAWRTAHAATGIDAADWIARHHPRR